MKEANAREQDFVEKLRIIILNNLSNEKFAVDDLAGATGLTPSALRRRLRAVSKKPANQLIREVRLQKAIELLCEEDATVSEVAYRVGFGSPAYFSKCFHEFFGYPPGEAKSKSYGEPEDKIEITRQAPVINDEKVVHKKPTKKIILYTAGSIVILFIIYLLFNNLPFENFSFLPGEKLNKEDKSITVFPFENLSGVEDNQFFVDGVTENILNNLTNIQEIKVINSPAEIFGDNPKDFGKISRMLGVRFILWGSIQRAGDWIRIIPKLTDTYNNRQIWSHIYDIKLKKLEDLFRIQSDIAIQVASALQTIIPKNEKERIEKVPTTSQEALTWYLMGHDLLARRSTRDPDTIKYISPFRKAIAADPDYAEAYAGLADVYIAITRGQCYPRPEGFRIAEENVLQALNLDPGLAEAHASLGALYRIEWKWEEARKEMETALELNPNNAMIQDGYADLMWLLRNKEAYKVHTRKAAELNPISPPMILSQAYVYRLEGNSEKVLEEYNRYIELYPDKYSVYFNLWHYYKDLGEEQKAAKSLQKAFLLTFSHADSAFSNSIPSIYKTKGMKGLEQRLYEHNILTDLKGSWRGLARYCVETGDKQKALDWLEKAYEWEIPNLPTINGDPDFEPLRNEPRFQALLDKMGLTPYQ